MRIGIYIGKLQDSKVGGGSTYQLSLLNELMKIDSEHEFFILYDNEKRLFEDKKNITFINMNVNKEKSKFNFKNLFKKKLKQQRFLLNEQVLKYHIELVWFMLPSYHYVEAPFILTVWDLQHRLQAYFPEVSLSGWDFDAREQFYKNAIPKSAYVIIGNDEGAKQISQFYNFPEERIKTIPLATPAFVFEKEGDNRVLTENNLEKGKYLFYPAQFWPHKNHIRIIKALAILKKQGLDFNAVFTGSDKGNEKYIKQKVKEYDLEKNVKFLGFVSEEELISLYKNAFAMTFASMFGPDNLPPLEAMALSCPVICADFKGSKKQLGDATLFFNSLDENDLAEKIKNLYENEAFKVALIKKGYDLALKYTVNNYVNEFLKLVEEFRPIRECWSREEKYIHL